jgi:hypothetical protein
MSVWHRAAALSLALVGLARPAAAGFFTSSPGPLSKAHAALDQRDKCTQCHADEHLIDDERCLRCHRPIAERRAAHRGVHGATANVGLACKLCHAEHKGRARELFGWKSIDPFDHGQLANFRLDGKHAEVRCLTCHKQTTRSGSTTYLAAPTTCGGCHQSQSRHGALSEALAHCDRCHSTREWRPLETLKFDHEREARFTLAGKHESVGCAGCHKGKDAGSPFVFRNPAWGSCAACHENVHGATSLFGRISCQSCHSAKVPFKEIHFDHKATHFPLAGAHRAVACAGCHRRQAPAAPKTTCAGCHADVHRGRFDKLGSDCGTCHTVASFKKIQFDHGRETHFTLVGAHQRARCGDCHRGKPPAEFENFSSLVSADSQGGVRVACMGCHKHENVHNKQFPNSRCLECHKSAGVVENRAEAITVGHGPTTRFPLVDRHAGLACSRCHRTGSFAGTSMECGSCHEDRLHHGSLGATCTRCHAGARSWEPSRFSHDQTRFPLLGKHRLAACAACHPARDFAAKPGTRTLACGECHADTHHKGEYGADCARCHAADGWLALHTGHDVPSLRFGGAHDRVACARCHAGGRTLAGTGELCIHCHRADDIHHNALPECATCHTQRSFSDIRFDHARIGCELKGAHRFLPCIDCHKGGNFVALATECVACHRADAVRGARAPGAPADHATQPTCGNCHNPHFWGPAARSGGTKESMCR